MLQLEGILRDCTILICHCGTRNQSKGKEEERERAEAQRDWLFAGTPSCCGLKSQDEMGTGRNSASLSHEVQHIQRKIGEPQACRKLEEGGN